jgi:hypothetical protein
MAEVIDTQVIEIIGRNYLVNQLYAAQVEVARPERDKGVDLIAYVDINDKFHAVPIQMKVATQGRFSIYDKYEKFNDLLLVYIWNLTADDVSKAEVYALTYAEAVQVATDMGWTESNSYKSGGYSSKISKKLQEKLHPFKMDSAEKWRKRLSKTWNL